MLPPLQDHGSGHSTSQLLWLFLLWSIPCKVSHVGGMGIILILACLPRKVDRGILQVLFHKTGTVCEHNPPKPGFSWFFEIYGNPTCKGALIPPTLRTGASASCGSQQGYSAENWWPTGLNWKILYTETYFCLIVCLHNRDQKCELGSNGLISKLGAWQPLKHPGVQSLFSGAVMVPIGNQICTLMAGQ